MEVKNNFTEKIREIGKNISDMWLENASRKNKDDSWKKVLKIFKTKRGIFLLGGTFLTGISVGVLGSLIFGTARTDSIRSREVISANSTGSGEFSSSSEYSSKDNQKDEKEGGCDLEVYISGAVNNSGVICLENDGIIADAIDIAGGFDDDYCQSWVERNINQAQKLQNNSQIFIPSMKDPECFGKQPSSSDLNSASSVSSAQGSNSKISINDASAKQLEEISGVGPSTAEKIIEGRPYNSIEDIKEVKGIGEATFEKLRDSICL
jgi:competence protein ComEA